MSHAPYIVFPLLFAVAAAASLALVSVLGGWHSLAQRYRAVRPAGGKRFAVQSMGVGSGRLPMGYNNCLTVHVSSEGLHLAVLPILPIMHPPLFIPWADVAAVSTYKAFVWTCYRVTLRRSTVCLTFYRDLGACILRTWQEREQAHAGRA